MSMMTLREAAQAMSGQLIGGDAALVGVSTDSRKTRSGELFIALRGETFDGHGFEAGGKSRNLVPHFVHLLSILIVRHHCTHGTRIH